MIAILKFDLSDIDGDKYDFHLTLKSWKMASMLEEIRNFRRHLYKYEARDNIPVSELIDKLNELLTEDE